MPKHARMTAIADELEELYPDVRCELDFKTPFELLVATILSAQCTDKRVNQVTPALFAKFPDARAMQRASPAVLAGLIRSTGFFNAKTKNILAASRLIVSEHDGEVPRTMEQLLGLPGVARKTANVILGTAFELEEGIAVDTHVIRLANRLGLSKEADPVKIERELCAIIPRPRWTRVGHQIIWHGRRVCFARSPSCTGCGLAQLCPSAFKVITKSVDKSAEKVARKVLKKLPTRSASTKKRAAR